MLTLKIAASIMMLMFMIYWIMVALWVYQSALKARLFAPAWGLVTLFTNLAGVLVYLIYRHTSVVCACCGAVQPRNNLFCTFCGSELGERCGSCGCGLKQTDVYCPKCGSKKQKI